MTMRNLSLEPCARWCAPPDRLAPVLAGLRRVAFTAELKGIAGEQSLLAFDVIGTAEMHRSSPPPPRER